MTGAAELPLHGGKVPGWMLRLMERMGEAILDSLVELKGPEAVRRGLADPVWFQAFNNIIGMDWDSSGSTTVLMGVLKSITWRRPDLGLLVLGGKGRHMRGVPGEAVEASKLLDVDPERIKFFSKATARADSVFLQDGYDLYHHAVVVDEGGGMIVVQQGMNVERGMARRYHLDRAVIEEPHTGVAGAKGIALNATARESREARALFIDLLNDDARRIAKLLAEANAMLRRQPSLTDFLTGKPGSKGINDRYRVYKPIPPDPRLIKAIENIARNPPTSEEELITAPSLGPKVIRALALIADLIYSTPVSTRDPVTHPLNPYIYAYAVGGKDGIPYRYDPKTAAKTIETLEDALNHARIGDKERLRAIMRLRRLIRGGPRGRY